MTPDAAFFDSATWLALSAVGIACWVTWGVSDLCRSACVPGSSRRYFWATIERGTRHLALLDAILVGAEGVGQRSIPDLAGAAFLVLIWHYVVTRRSHDDDNWFRDTKKRLTRWATGLGRRPAPVGVR